MTTTENADVENPYHLHPSDNDRTSVIVVGAYGRGYVNSRGFRHPSYKLGKPPQLQVSDATWGGLETLLLESEKERQKRMLEVEIFALVANCGFFIIWNKLIAVSDVLFFIIFVVTMVLLFLLHFVVVPRARKALLQDVVDQMQLSFASDGYRIFVGKATNGACCCFTEAACLEFELIGRTTTTVV